MLGLRLLCRPMFLFAASTDLAALKKIGISMNEGGENDRSLPPFTSVLKLTPATPCCIFDTDPYRLPATCPKLQDLIDVL